MGTAPTVMSHWLSVTPERVVKWIVAVPGATDHAVPYGSIEMTSNHTWKSCKAMNALNRTRGSNFP